MSLIRIGVLLGHRRKTLARRAIAWQRLDDPVDVRTREKALFRDYRARFGKLPPISTKTFSAVGNS